MFTQTIVTNKEDFSQKELRPMKAKNFLRVGLTVALGALISVSASAKEPKDPDGKSKKESLFKSAGSPRYQILNINNLTTWMRSDGHSNHSPGADNGVYYPRGTGNVIYQDCVVWGGKVFTNSSFTSGPGVSPPGDPAQPVRIGGGTYGVGTRAGAVTGFGSSAVAADPNAADVRVYRIRRDYATMTDDDYIRDAQSFFEHGSVNDVSQSEVDQIRAYYAADWTNWPVALGAPYIDRNGNGTYDAPPAFNTDENAGPLFTAESLITQGRDEPGVAGGDPNSPADQVMWTVYNDLSETDATNFEGSRPIGLEVQKTIWGYKRSDALGNLYFSRYKFINKGGVDTSAAAGDQLGSFWVDSMYFCQWSDPDLGSFSDDLLGCDTTLSMGYVYNANGIDGTYRQFNLPPPAAGYDFLAGPTVPAPGDSGIFNLQKVYGVRNLGMSSFAYFSAGSPYSDPNGGADAYLDGSGQWWKMLRGFAPLGTFTTGDDPYAFPPDVGASKFPLSGNPVTGTGWIDGAGEQWSFVTGDRRLLVTTGPFRMAPGDTQEVYVGFVVGIGADRLSSVSVMKFNDQFVQNTFNALFQVPRAPQSPNVAVAELDGEIILSWGGDLTRLADIETRVNNPGGYTFEGYNVYQLPSRGARLSEGKRIVTFDKTSDPTVVLDQQFDETSGQILSLPVQFGANSGIKRFLKVSRDYVKDIEKLYNGQEYYFVVTAYAVATVPGFLPAALESDPVTLTVQPKDAFGKTYVANHGDTLAISHASGNSDGTIRPIVIDPAAADGKTYQVGFDTTGGNKTWFLREAGGSTIISGKTNESGDDNYDFVPAGIFLKVEGPPPGIKREDVYTGGIPESGWGWAWKPNNVTGSGNSRFLTWSGSDGFGFESFQGSLGYASARWAYGDGTLIVPPDKLKKVEIRFAPTTDNLGNFDPNDPNASYAYRYGRGFASAAADPAYAPFIINAVGGYSYQDYTISMPLGAYDIDANPPRRLSVGFLENNAAPDAITAAERVNGRYWPPFYGRGDNVSGAGPREWLWIFDEDYTTTPNPTYMTDIIGGDQRTMYWAAWARRNDNPWPSGQSFIINPTRPNTVADVFEYTATAPTGGVAAEKAHVEKIGVFPNPYYAFNPAETNRFARFVTFNNLPKEVKIKIFNLAGQLVRTLDKNDDSQFLRWDLTNHATFPVASGMYIAHLTIKLPSNGSEVTKVLKFAVIQEQEILNSY
jgi:hypothetical protein